MPGDAAARPPANRDGLRARVVMRLACFTLDVSIACPRGQLLAIVGPSGSGKTRLLRCLAGLERPDDGRIQVDGGCWLDTSARLCLPPQKRSAGLLFQEYGLFPHMTVRRNVAFAAHPGADVDDLLGVFGIAALADRLPSALSGGERQRASLCQAIARRPKLLLLDEPFSALDMENRFALRGELARLKREWDIPVLYVTHDLADALVVGDDLIALRLGRLDDAWLGAQIGLLRQEHARLRRRIGPFHTAGTPSARPLPQTARSAS